MWRYMRVLTLTTGSADVALHACSDADDRVDYVALHACSDADDQVGSMWRYMRVLTLTTASASCGVTCVF